MEQNQFSRSLYNDYKLGAYYTDVGHAARLGQFFSLTGETCILEPSFGDAEAILSFLKEVTGKAEDKKVFGVELNTKTFEENKHKLNFSTNADFLHGVRITPKAFSLCFANPPYGNCNDGKDRLETEFVKKLYTYAAPGGYLVLIVPRATIEDADFQRQLLSRFERLQLFKFDEKEYAKYKQYAFIGKRRRTIGVFKNELDSFRHSIRNEEIKPIPQNGEYQKTRYSVPATKESDVVLFTSIEFDYETAGKNVAGSTLTDKISNILIHPHNALKVGDPPLPLKKDLLYLSSIAGAGEGLTGSEKDGDLHLQRGTVTIEKSITYLNNEDLEGESGTMIASETSKAVVSINIIDNSGNCICLK